MSNPAASTTVLLEIVPADGTAAWTDAYQATPPSTFDDWQPGVIPIRIRHDGPTVGFIDYLEHSLGYGGGAMFGVGVIRHIPAADVDGKVQASAEIIADSIARNVEHVEWEPGPNQIHHRRKSTRSIGNMYATTAELHAVAFVDRTASLSSTRCKAWDGDYRDIIDRNLMKASRTHPLPDIIIRAAEAASTELRHRRPERLLIHHPADEYRAGGRAEINWHGGGRILAVR